jgi:hypothetical protein
MAYRSFRLALQDLDSHKHRSSFPHQPNIWLVPRQLAHVRSGSIRQKPSARCRGLLNRNRLHTTGGVSYVAYSEMSHEWKRRTYCHGDAHTSSQTVRISAERRICVPHAQAIVWC